MNRTDAKAFCQVNRMDLLSIESKKEMENIVEKAKFYGSNIAEFLRVTLNSCDFYYLKRFISCISVGFQREAGPPNGLGLERRSVSADSVQPLVQ